MNVYNKSTLLAFSVRHADCRDTLGKWFNDVTSKVWEKPGEVTKDFNTARAIKNNRVIFKINKNNYRLIAEINYEKGWVFIKFIGTHAEYERVDAVTVDKYKKKK